MHEVSPLSKSNSEHIEHTFGLKTFLSLVLQHKLQYKLYFFLFIYVY